MTISKEERAELREECKRHNSVPSSTDFKITRLLDALEAAEERAESYERKTTMPCPYCDFASGQRGGDRCPHCDGTGRVSVLPWLKADRDEWKARVEEIEKRAKRLQAAFDAWERGSDCGTCPLQNEPECDEICSYKAKLIAYCAEERARAEAAEREFNAIVEVAECFAPCPLLYREECGTCLSKKENRLACLKERARQQARGGEI